MLPPSLTRPVTAQAADLNALYRDVGGAVALLTKAGAAVKTHALSGELQLSSSGWGLLKVPNALVRGAFDALDEPGAELPLHNGKLNAHISVLRPEDIAQIGGPDKIKEFGHHFRYTLGAVMEVKPAGWKDVSKVWFLKVESPDLERLRRSYGLSSLPKGGKHDFHVTVGIRRVHVLGHNDVAKKGHHLPRDGRESGVQHLEGDENPVLEPVPQAVQGLRGEGYHGLRKVGEQLHHLLRGHGTVSAGPNDREEGEQPGVQSRELRLAAEKQAEQEPPGQPVSRIPRGASAPGRVGGADWAFVPHDRQPDRHPGLVGRESADDGSSGVKLAEAVPDDGRRDSVLDGVVEAIREASGFGGGPAQARLDVAGCPDYAAYPGWPQEAVDRLLKIAGRDEPRGPEGEYCPHCDARLERDPYSGTCNSCGEKWDPGDKRAAHVPLGGTVSYDYHCGPCDHSFDGCAGVCPLCGGDRSATTTNPRLKTAAGLLAGLLEAG